jgi:methylmalonyl-CoA mutase
LRRPCRLYERRKHDGSLPLVGVSTFTDPGADRAAPAKVELTPGHRGRKAEPAGLAGRFPGQARRGRPGRAAPPQGGGGEQNVFAALMEAVRHCSLGQISEAFFEVGGQYGRNV